MTLEELIDHEEKGSKATWNGKPTLCAEEHRQLAEWLKDYKRLLEQKLCKVNELPPVTAEKVGHWIGIDEEPHEDWECDRCGHIEYANEDLLGKYHFCPNCGAMMSASPTGEEVG